MCPSFRFPVLSIDGQCSPEGYPLPRLQRDDIDRLVDRDDAAYHDHANHRRAHRDRRSPRPAEANHRPPRARGRADGRESFKCGRCRAFVGPTVSGGRHRNHCPLCLTSRHVDARRPGDRASPCRALMAPVGTFFRPKGEQVVLHRCNGCGVERHNRVAADDNPLALLRLALLRLALVPPRVGGRRGEAEEAIA